LPDLLVAEAVGDGVGVAAAGVDGLGAAAVGGGVGVGIGRCGVGGVGFTVGVELAVGVDVAVGVEPAGGELADALPGAMTGELADATVRGTPVACPGALPRAGLAAAARRPELPAEPAAGDVALVVFGGAGES
jgi:hypothetical protein